MASELPAHSGRPPASARVFERDGFLDARITDIAATAGVASGRCSPRRR